MLSGNCSEWSTGRAYIPCPTVTIVNWCNTVMQTVRQHQEGGRWASTWKKFLKIRDWETDKYTYLGGTFTTQSNINDGPFPQKYSAAKSRSLFSQNSSITDVRICSKNTSIPYMTYLSKSCVSTKKMLTKLAHKKYLKKATNSKKKELYQQKTRNILT